MQSRLAASVHPLSAGICSRRIRDAVSLRSIVNFFDSGHWQINSSFQSRGFMKSSWPRHSSAVENDAFSELGPEISECSAKQIKLVTEKPDRFVKTDPHRREVASKPLSSDTRPKIKDIVSTIGKASQTLNTKITGHKNVSKLTVDTKKISDTESLRSVSIKNIISTVGLSELVEAISGFGKVSSASFTNASNGLRCCNVEFENVESRRRAISAGKVAVGSQVCRIHPVDDVDVVAVRITNINKETTDHAIHSKCKSVGEFVGLARTSMDVVDAFFNVRYNTIQLSILEKLNNTVVDEKRWSAHVLTSDSAPSESFSDQEASYKLSFRIFDDLKKQLFLKKINLEDLENLNASIMHLQCLPPVTDLSGNK